MTSKSSMVAAKEELLALVGATGIGSGPHTFLAVLAIYLVNKIVRAINASGQPQ
jgi:hypothetical protein